MNKGLEAYYKLDHTCCLNANENNIKFGCIKDDEDRDCKDINEMVDCLDDIEKELKSLEIIRKKRINLDLMSFSKNYEHYCRVKKDLTEKEYELLKEVLL